MAKRIVQGPIRNKEKTKEKLLLAVGEILKTKGYKALKVNDIAAVSGVNKRLIYEYFGGVDELADAYIKQQDYWNVLTKLERPENAENSSDFVTNILRGQYDELHRNQELRKIMLWELSEKRDILTEQVDLREANGEQIFQNLTDPHFGENAKRFRAVTALIIAGSYYLNLIQETNGTTFCGLNLKTEQGRNEIKNAIDFIIKKTYEK
ncbi:TetR/AcrR family transcriptional regulator [Pedobacter aquatilis]|uniref:TetR/AcrR family transcriptional regulator n=1 Tax=Pedobacter aquatilis TaxID=351343 RepID=UPI0029310FED|nr:TetR/AcrR family transcriptional regulator [Pedobacter aquatilis]